MNKLRADAVYYRKVYMGNLDVDDREITRLLNKAYDNILISSMGRPLEVLKEYEIDIVKRAACYEAEAIYEIEGISGGGSVIGGVNSWSIDGVSMNYNGTYNENHGVKNGGVVDKRALGLLNNTSLRDRMVY